MREMLLPSGGQECVYVRVSYACVHMFICVDRQQKEDGDSQRDQTSSHFIRHVEWWPCSYTK